MMTNKMVKLPSVFWWLYCLICSVGQHWFWAVSKEKELPSMLPNHMSYAGHRQYQGWLTGWYDSCVTFWAGAWSQLETTDQLPQDNSCFLCYCHAVSSVPWLLLSAYPNQLMKHLTAGTPLSPLAELEDWNECGRAGAGFTCRWTKRISNTCPV